MTCFQNASVPNSPRLRHPHAKLHALARYCAPDAREVAQWYRLACAAYSSPQLAALGIDSKRQANLSAGILPARQLWRSIWLAYSYAYAPGNLASPYAWSTWGRFNPQNADTADLLARRWADHNKKRKPQPWRRKRQSPARPPGDIHPGSQQFFLPPL